MHIRARGRPHKREIGGGAGFGGPGRPVDEGSELTERARRAARGAQAGVRARGAGGQGRLKVLAGRGGGMGRGRGEGGGGGGARAGGWGPWQVRPGAGRGRLAGCWLYSGDWGGPPRRPDKGARAQAGAGAGAEGTGVVYRGPRARLGPAARWGSAPVPPRPCRRHQIRSEDEAARGALPEVCQQHADEERGLLGARGWRGHGAPRQRRRRRRAGRAAAAAARAASENEAAGRARRGALPQVPQQHADEERGLLGVGDPADGAHAARRGVVAALGEAVADV
jgi:hypothetical protein